MSNQDVYVLTALMVGLHLLSLLFHLLQASLVSYQKASLIFFASYKGIIFLINLRIYKSFHQEEHRHGIEVSG